MDMESLKKLKGTVEKCIDELSKKTDLTPAETKAALDGMQLRDMLLCEIEQCKMQDEYSESNGYSGYPSFPRHYNMTAYGQSAGRMYSEQNRSSRMGGSGAPSYNSSHDGSYGYSRHSVGDRAVEKLENLMDSAQSEYEREEVKRFIRMIRQAAD